MDHILDVAEFENSNCKKRLSKQCENAEILPYCERPMKAITEIGTLDQLVADLHKVFASDHVNVEYVSQLMMNYKSNPADWKKYSKFDRFKYTRNLVDAGNGAFNIMVLCWGGGHGSAIHDHADSHCFMKILSGQLEEVRFAWPKDSTSEVEKQKEFTNNQRNNGCRCSDIEDLNAIFEANVQLGETDGNNEKCLNEEQPAGDANEHVAKNPKCPNGECHAKKCSQSENPCTDGDHNGNNIYESSDYDINLGMQELGRSRLELNDVCYINDSIGLHRVENPSHIDGAVSLHLYCPPFDACRVFDARTGKATKAPVTFWSKYGKRRSRAIQEVRAPEYK